jgi:hypothetical protein
MPMVTSLFPRGSVRRGGLSDSENAAIARPHFGPDDGIAGLGDSL